MGEAHDLDLKKLSNSRTPVWAEPTTLALPPAGGDLALKDYRIEEAPLCHGMEYHFCQQHSPAGGEGHRK